MIGNKIDCSTLFVKNNCPIDAIKNPKIVNQKGDKKGVMQLDYPHVFGDSLKVRASFLCICFMISHFGEKKPSKAAEIKVKLKMK